jgi:hypothetical protein
VLQVIGRCLLILLAVVAQSVVDQHDATNLPQEPVVPCTSAYGTAEEQSVVFASMKRHAILNTFDNLFRCPLSMTQVQAP